MKIILNYLKHNWLIYSILAIYTLALLTNTLGINFWLPSCPISRYIGYECFGCGLNHAAIALLSGEIKEAFNLNPLLFIYIPLILGWIIYDFYKFNLKTTKNLA